MSPVSPCGEGEGEGEGEEEGEWEGEEEGVRVLGTMDVDHCGRSVDEEERPDQNERATEQNFHPERQNRRDVF